ncbi:MAG TPA: hypothetical protein VG328_11650 [Stellaceae bacterium]|jgi:hypothetical protein|nr:hypothetical protein [Stellaceae bacterium]
MLPQCRQPGAPAAAPADNEKPALRAMEILEACLRKAERENTLRDLVSMDLRSIALLRKRYTEKPRDSDNYKLLRQLAVVWSTRLSGNDYRTFRELFRLVEKCEKP